MSGSNSKKIKIAEYIAYTFIIFIILGMNVIRFMGLEKSPPGFHVDELSMAVTIQCLATEKIDAYDNHYPLFGEVRYGSPKPPTYMYAGMLWTKMFGFSIASFRAFSAFITVLTLVGLFFLSRTFFGVLFVLFVLLSASISPWAFQISRIGLEGCMAPCFLIWGMYFFLRSSRKIDALAAGAFWAVAMYNYPATRLYLPLFFMALIFFKKHSNQFNLKATILCALTIIVLCIPLMRGILNGEYMSRFNEISIFSNDYLSSIGKAKNFVNILQIFISNYAQHFSPAFLFFTGDSNYVYGTGAFGQLSWLDIVALIGALGLLVVFLINRCRGRAVDTKESSFVLLMVAGILLAVIPSALTWAGIPHSLRTVHMWPLISLLTGYVFWKISKHFVIASFIGIIVSLIFCHYYLDYYFTVYPKRAYFNFNGYTKDQVLRAKSIGDWLVFIQTYQNQNFHLRYYLMNYSQGQSCSSTQRLWKKIYKPQ